MRLLVNYYGPQGTFPTYAVADVLHGRVPETALRDKIVLIGGAAVGVGDTIVTPFSPALPGLERRHGDGQYLAGRVSASTRGHDAP